MNCTTTITFGDVAENHHGMEKIGKLAARGFTLKDLVAVKKIMEAQGCETELVDLRELVDVQVEEAWFLIIRQGVQHLVHNGADKLLEEMKGLVWDTKALMRGRVVNKHARHNLCFDEKSSNADYEKGKGTVIPFDRVPVLDTLKHQIEENFGQNFQDLKAEGNLYFDVKKCGIGMHGDSERRKVLAVRVGASLPFWVNWYHETKPIGRKAKFVMNHGDMYVMSEKTSGFDWKRRTIPTLRHAAGEEKWSLPK
jgi:hypothetical protein